MRYSKIQNKPLLIGLICLLGIVLLSLAFWFRSSEKQEPTGNSVWQTYRSERFGIEIKHPPEWVPHEGLSLSYNDKDFPWLLRVCFGPAVQTKNYCGVELYVISANNFPKPTNNIFLGEQRAIVEGIAYSPKFGDYEGIAIPTIRQNGVYQEHAFIENNGLVYLLTPRNVPGTKEFNTFREMLPTVKFSTPFSSETWRTYENKKFGFSIQYPPNVEVEMEHDFTTPVDKSLPDIFYTYRSEKMNKLFYVCFPSIARAEFYCEYELYVLDNPISTLTNTDTFLGYPKCEQEKTYRPMFDGQKGIEIRTCDNNKSGNNVLIPEYRNALVEHDGKTYLFMTEPGVGNIGEKDILYHQMIQSFRFLDSKTSASSTVPFNSQLQPVKDGPVQSWKTFTSVTLSYKLLYPNNWGVAPQSDGLVDFGPGNPKPAQGKIALDMECLYGTQTKIYGEKTEEEFKNVTFGNNQYVEKKIYVMNADGKILSFHNYTITLPNSYTGNACKTASFIVRDYDLEEEIIAPMLSSFKVEAR